MTYPSNPIPGRPQRTPGRPLSTPGRPKRTPAGHCPPLAGHCPPRAGRVPSRRSWFRAPAYNSAGCSTRQLRHAVPSDNFNRLLRQAIWQSAPADNFNSQLRQAIWQSAPADNFDRQLRQAIWQSAPPVRRSGQRAGCLPTRGRPCSSRRSWFRAPAYNFADCSTRQLRHAVPSDSFNGLLRQAI